MIATAPFGCVFTTFVCANFVTYIQPDRQAKDLLVFLAQEKHLHHQSISSAGGEGWEYRLVAAVACFLTRPGSGRKNSIGCGKRLLGLFAQPAILH